MRGKDAAPCVLFEVFTAANFALEGFLFQRKNKATYNAQLKVTETMSD